MLDAIGRERATPPTSARSVARSHSNSVANLGSIVGNQGMARLLNSRGPMRAELQRMTTFWLAAEHGGASVGGQWNLMGQQPIGQIVHQRASIPNDVKRYVDGFNDNDGSTNYKHYVPYQVIVDAVLDRHIAQGVTTLAEVVDIMTNLLDKCAVALQPKSKPFESRPEFNTWLDEALVALADNPYLIYRWSDSSGDGGGTRLDRPQLDPFSPLFGTGKQLSDRLNRSLALYEENLGITPG